MKLQRPKARFLFFVGAVTTASILAYLTFERLKPVDKVGPFSKAETAFVVSEDGRITVSRLWIGTKGELLQKTEGTTQELGKIKVQDKNGLITIKNGEVTLRCLTVDASSAVCGSKRLQKSLGKFQFDRKIPFVIDEMIMGGFSDPGGGAASTVGTVMFRSDDSSFWIKSEKVGSYRFLSPTQFEITWKAPLIYTDGSNRGHVLNMPPTTRTASCIINKEIQESIICNGSAARAGKSYSAIWKYVDSDDAKNALGAPSHPKTIMNSRD